MRRSRSGWAIWAAPLALGVASAVGLSAALLSDGLGDALSWVALAAPVAVAGWHMGRTSATH